MTEKLLFLDLDGTVIWPGTFEMPESTRKAIQAARAKGHKAIICTGRNMGMIRPVLSYGFDGIIASAGAYIEIGDKVLVDHPMPEEDKELAFELFQKHDILMQPESFETLYIEERIYDLYGKMAEDQGDSELIRMRRQSDAALGCKMLSAYQGEPIYKILYMTQDPANFQEPERKMGEKYFFLKHPTGEDGITHGELISHEVGKGKALNLVMEYYQKEKSDTIAFGDSMNDAEMIAEAGYSVCMGNSPEKLKEMANYVCPDQAEDGLAIAFQYLQLV